MKRKAITYYHILGVTPAATDVQIRQAYIRLVQKYHPDRHPNNQEAAAHKFKLVHTAYMSLKTTPQRKAYNRYLMNVQNERGDSLVLSQYESNDNRFRRKSFKDNRIVKAASLVREVLWPIAPSTTHSTAARRG
jgi:DnaJ-class molecular chaperone